MLIVDSPQSYIEIPATKCATIGYDLPNRNGHPLLKGSSGPYDDYVGLGNDDKGATTGYDYGLMIAYLEWDVSTSYLTGQGLPSSAQVYKVELVWRRFMNSPSLNGKLCKVRPCTSYWNEFNVNINTMPNTTTTPKADFYWPSQSVMEEDMTAIWDYWKGNPSYTNYGVEIHIPTASQYECALLYSCHSSNEPLLRIHYQ